MTENQLLWLPRILKRTMDISIVIVGGLCSLPLVALIGLLIKVSSPGPAIYGSERIGCRGRRFYAWKFRTMVVHADEALERYLTKHPEKQDEWEKNYKLDKDPRITRLGRLLRRTSLDELPQLWNVLVGEMSLVGPRPLLRAESVSMAKTAWIYMQKCCPA